MGRIAMAEKLEAQAARLRREAARPLPDEWAVGMRVRYLRDRDWAWDEGWLGTVIEVPGDRKFPHFYTLPDKHRGRFYTTTDDVALVAEEEG